MNRSEYISGLEQELKRLPKQERREAIDYYEEYFEEAGPEREQEVIVELGLPKEASAQILREAAMKRLEEPRRAAGRGLSTVWIVILAICAVPVGLPLALGAFTVVLAVVICLLAVGAAFGVAGVSMLGAGIASTAAGIVFLPAYPPDGIAVLGTGLVSSGAGILMILLTILVVKGGINVFAGCMRILLTKGKRHEKEMA